MNTMPNVWIDGTLAESVVLTMIHFLWQGAMISAIALAVTLVLRRASAEARYLTLGVALLGIVVAAGATFAWVYSTRSLTVAVDARSKVSDRLSRDLVPTMAFGPASDAVASASEYVASETVEMPPAGELTVLGQPDDAKLSGQWWREASWLLQPMVAWVALLYASGVVLLLGRVLLGLYGGNVLRKHSTLLSQGAVNETLSKHAKALRLHRVPKLKRCTEIAVPTVIGVVWPTVLLPASLLSEMSPQQIEAILIHELAHIRRYDFLVNVLQRVVEAVLFFHPAVWWISSRMRVERELCCDDIVLRHGVEPVRYARLLVDVAEYERRLRPLRGTRLVVGLQATGRTSQVAERVRRVLDLGYHESFRLDRGQSFGLVAAAALIGVIAPWPNQPTAANLTETMESTTAETQVATERLTQEELRASLLPPRGLSPRETVAGFLRQLAEGEKTINGIKGSWGYAWAYTTGETSFGIEMQRMARRPNFRPVAHLHSDDRVIVLTTTERPSVSSVQPRVGVFELVGRDGRWLIQKMEVYKPESAWAMAEGFSRHTDVQWKVLPSDFVGHYLTLDDLTHEFRADGHYVQRRSGQVAAEGTWRLENGRLIRTFNGETYINPIARVMEDGFAAFRENDNRYPFAFYRVNDEPGGN